MSADSEKQYPVHEVFHSWQGEGCHLGKSAFFIRLLGCPVRCPWCDSAGTWHSDYTPNDYESRSAKRLADQAKQSGAEFAVLTGGEPAIHDLAPFVAAFKSLGMPLHLETCGGFPIAEGIDWITVSPKWQKMPLKENVERASEFKLIIDEPNAIEKWEASMVESFVGRPVWLHPEWSQRENGDILNAITNWVKARGHPYRAGWQAHKQYRADILDKGSRPAAPLGGNPGLGY